MEVVSSFGFQVSMRKLQVFFDEKSGGPPALRVSFSLQ